MARTTVLWDLRSCPVPPGCDPPLVGPRIESALKDAGFLRPYTITAIGNFKLFPDGLLQDLFSSGIALKHINGDFENQTDLLEWARCNPAPASLVLICGPSQLERLAPTVYKVLNLRYSVAVAYSKRKRHLDWLWKSFLSNVHTHWLWESFLEVSGVLQGKHCNSDWCCTQCNTVGQSFADFTAHLKSESHSLKESEPPTTAPPATSTMVKSRPKKAAVFWHINSCPLPSRYSPHLVYPRIVSALKSLDYSCPVTVNAIGNLEHTPVKLLQELSSNGIALKHVQDEFHLYLFAWKMFVKPPAVLMIIANHDHLEHLSSMLFRMHNQGYTILLAYPQRAPGSEWLWKSFLAVSVKNWPWRSLLDGSRDNKRTKRTHALEEKCGEARSWFCSECRYHADGFEDFITHLKSEEHAEEVSIESVVPEPNETPATSTMVDSQAKKTSVLWDINSCPVPLGFNPCLVGPRIVSALEESGYSGPFTITALGNLEHSSDALLQDLASSGIVLKHDIYEFQSNLYEWGSHNPSSAKATLMVICGHQQLEKLCRYIYNLFTQGHIILLAYPQRLPDSEWLWRGFFKDIHKDWLWHDLLKVDSGSVDGETMTRQQVLQGACTETGDWICRVCDFDGKSIESFITHLRSEEHTRKGLATVAGAPNQRTLARCGSLKT